MQLDLSIQGSSPTSTAVQMAIAEVLEAPWENWFERWLHRLQGNLPPASTYELSLCAVDDLQIQTLNDRFRQQDRPTDVLAFAALEANIPHPEEMPLDLGEIIISVETAERQAAQRQHPLVAECGWLAAHGLLHLLGWDHPCEDRLMEMLHQQDILLRDIGLQPPTPLI
ncbi:rRNA maturation RNase YbeY [Oscillatoriales cyanobacterium LEGE 11467]|uniref:Endoribonuclease YbeY n=1 Tax=Zarconia navalis LEGE 11467 TaxID=1828826 RepID=A0A928ZAT2_9CYAN|nr:rRNA maturation RNase YbeY [Zarconia navalis]MBE9041966.1 rRNA maturation RNase YbeY [Zarconia navalis LEGE 11467]